MYTRKVNHAYRINDEMLSSFARIVQNHNYFENPDIENCTVGSKIIRALEMIRVEKPTPNTAL